MFGGSADSSCQSDVATALVEFAVSLSSSSPLNRGSIPIGTTYPLQLITPGPGIGDGAEGYSDVVYIIPLSVIRWICATSINEFIKKFGDSTGGSSNWTIHEPGFTHKFWDTTMFCIEPGAGIGGIGNGF